MIVRAVQSQSQLVLNLWFGLAVRSFRESDLVFKDYFSRRLTLAPSDYRWFLHRLSSTPFSPQDHRWLSLAANIQERLDSFSASEKVYMLKELVGMSAKNTLLEKLLDDLTTRAPQLPLLETVHLLWAIAKADPRKRLNTAAQLLARIGKQLGAPGSGALLLRREGGEGGTREAGREGEGEGTEGVVVTAACLSMVLHCQATLGVVQPEIVKRVVRDGVRANLAVLSATSLCTILLSLSRLGLRSSRDTILIYRDMRAKSSEFEGASPETLLNLACTLSNLLRRQLSQQEQKKLEKYQDQATKVSREKEDMKVFFLWAVETLLIKQPQLPCGKAALVLHYAALCQAYERSLWLALLQRLQAHLFEAKVVDLVMAVRALAELPSADRTFHAQHEDLLLKRLWQLQNSINGRSVQALASLYQRKLLKPPPRIAKLLSEHLAALQVRQFRASSTSTQ